MAIPLIRSFLICDDIRQEIDGKQTLVGVYTSAILVPSLPTSLLSLAIRTELTVTAGRHVGVYFSIKSPSGKEITRTPNGEVEFGDPRLRGAFAVKFINFALTEEGLYTVEMGIDSLSFDVGDFQVLVNQSPAHLSLGEKRQSGQSTKP